MKNILIFFLVVIASCGPPTPIVQPKETIIKKVIKAKKEQLKTDYDYKMDWFNGKLRHQPNIHSSFYFVFTDGSYNEVNIGEYAIREVGDTIIQKQYNY